MEVKSKNVDQGLAPSQQVAFDVAVLGSGLAGLSAAWAAAKHGARVLVLEKKLATGGSSALSAGMFWTAPSFEAYRRRIPLGDPALGQQLVQDYEAALAEIRATGISVAPEPLTSIMGFGIGYSLAIRELLSYLESEIVAAGGQVLTGAKARGVRHEETFYHMAFETARGALNVQAGALVVATGGFQGSKEKLAVTVGRNSDRLVLRSNPGSVGEGLDVALSLGAAGSGGLPTFYGHLLPYPLQEFTSADFLPLSQYYSDHSVLVNFEGRRFVDEHQGDELSNQALTFQPRAAGVLIFDHQVRLEHATAEPFPGLGVLDRYDAAVQAGARHAEGPTLDAVWDQVASWGIPRETLSATFAQYQAAVEAGGGHAGGAPVSAAARAPQTAPFYALQVQPSITFTFGGIRIDAMGRALDADGVPVTGLFAAGADIGGLSNYGYAGGLAPAYITGRWAGAAAAAHVDASTSIN